MHREQFSLYLVVCIIAFSLPLRGKFNNGILNFDSFSTLSLDDIVYKYKSICFGDNVKVRALIEKLQFARTSFVGKRWQFCFSYQFKVLVNM